MRIQRRSEQERNVARKKEKTSGAKKVTFDEDEGEWRDDEDLEESEDEQSSGGESDSGAEEAPQPRKKLKSR